MKETASKQAEDGTFTEGYGEFLVTMLQKLQVLKGKEEQLYAHQIEDEDITTLFKTPVEALPGGDWQATARNVEAVDCKQSSPHPHNLHLTIISSSLHPHLTLTSSCHRPADGGAPEGRWQLGGEHGRVR